MRRSFLVLAILAVAGLAAPAVQADDDAIAQFIFERLKAEQQIGTLKGYRVDMRVDHGTVWFKGHVSNADQEMLILRTPQQAGKLGVVQVVDDIDVRSPSASAAQVVPSTTEESIAKEPALPVSWTQPAEAMVAPTNTNAMVPPTMMPMEAPVQAQATGPSAFSQTPVNVANATGAPMPVAYAGGMGITTDNPQLPGYAWPAYAAHPNYAAVTYPRQYSASAWPYIGPFYPYPQVPLGWRRVTLEWDDGWWYLDFADRSHSGCCH